MTRTPNPHMEDVPHFGTTDDILTLQDLAELFGVRPATITRWRYSDPPIPVVRFGKQPIFSKRQVGDWLDKLSRTYDPTKGDVMRALRQAQLARKGTKK